MNLIVIVLAACALALLLGAPGLVALIPPLRRAARANRAARLALVIGAALAAFLLMDGLVSALTATTDMFFRLFDTVPPDNLGAAPQDSVAVLRELWLRKFNPLPDPACYTTADACAWADFIIKGTPGSPPMQYQGWTLEHFAGLIPAATSLGVALWLTRKVKTATPPGE